ncbi:holo-[acyl-carrier protein] synthase [Bacillus mesophilus]|uniref:Holo-[acyl-carrier-protein] synthase n=1 Tax=Bacillus mesophilus TaxID=1808955 RepID=A0A6M0QC71_9BACI|nr:holo-ACP synthase [Bacillus mesophilus]MBM7663138.1 holo-[acyl-carrier protein] synthase [Bacillus mesophilus]NEY73886.1 holo-ACP synthase [Bacillus mesophilus]
MIKGIGVDIIELNRIEELASNKKFIHRILTHAEIETFLPLTNRRKIEYLAGRFAAKEAFSKAMGTGIGKNLQFIDIEVSQDSFGKPYISKPFATGVHLSISHSKEYAVAQVIIESSSS